jgi:hypothetical protein
MEKNYKVGEQLEDDTNHLTSEIVREFRMSSVIFLQFIPEILLSEVYFQ